MKKEIPKLYEILIDKLNAKIDVKYNNSIIQVKNVKYILGVLFHVPKSENKKIINELKKMNLIEIHSPSQIRVLYKSKRNI